MLLEPFDESFSPTLLIHCAPVKPFDSIAREAAQRGPGTCLSLRTPISSQFLQSWSGRLGLALNGSEHRGKLAAHRFGGLRDAVHRGMTTVATCVMLALARPDAGAAASSHGERPAHSESTILSAGPWSGHIREAAKRFAIPERLLRGVIQIESFGDVRALSSKGAMGLMQIMPATWEELRIKYRLGDDPYKPRDNILAGAAYLREMLDSFGRSGFLAAYNAGPGRYKEHLSAGRPLPRETVDYVRKLAPLLNGAVPSPRRARQGRGRASSLGATIFAHPHDIGNAAASGGNGYAETIFTAIHSPAMRSPMGNPVADLTATEPRPGETDFQSNHAVCGLFTQPSLAISR
ncbi:MULTISPECIES: lytic transglycosylase domain-containing protein [unclassified Mesorhizobium]|uniref:lytic transglycosylase domain-containing protein n=1 Tax=unclassified Mesorhizobium TaxID=325217 RepID=UPI00333B74D5